jgi:parvulin-like peptidyl-prolyl isomerase
MTQASLRRPPKTAANAPRDSSAAEQASKKRPPRTVPSSRLVRRPALHAGERRDGQGLWFGWGAGLTRAQKEHAKERVAILTLSSVLALAVLLLGGTLLWDQVIYAWQPVARVDGKSISLRTFADVLAYRQNVLYSDYQLAEQIAALPTPVPTDGSEAPANSMAIQAQLRMQQIQNELANLDDGVVEDLIEAELIRAEASRRGIVASPGEVDAALRQVVGFQDPSATPIPAVVTAPDGEATADSETSPVEPTAQPSATSVPPAATAVSTDTGEAFAREYREYLRYMAGTDSVVRAEVVTQILRRKLNDELARSVAPSAEQVSARHILVPDETAAQAVLARLAAGETFEALAAELSTDTSNKNDGGDLGWFPRGAMVKEFEDAAFALEPGQVSQPVKSSFGTHVIRVDAHDANRELEPDLLQSLRSGALSRWLEQAKTEHSVERLLDPAKAEWARRHGRQAAGQAFA